MRSIDVALIRVPTVSYFAKGSMRAWLLDGREHVPAKVSGLIRIILTLQIIMPNLER